LDALGRFSDRSVRAELGFLMIWLMTVVAAPAKVVMRKTWTTWKAKYHDWVWSST
jgi:hypothetical protein